MKIAVINKKGGVGKTPFAFSIAKDLDLYLQSNDNSCIEQIYKGKAAILEQVKNIDNCVYDFGGFSAAGVLDIIKICNFVIIPSIIGANSILRSIETINEIKEANNNIIILATGFLNMQEELLLEEELISNVDKFPVFYFKYSKIIQNAITYGQSFTELYKENGLSRNSYSNFYNEYRRLLAYLQRNK